MYLKHARIRHFRGIRELDWQPKSDQLRGWHVILGDNSSGKTSFMRALALCILGPTEAGRAFPNSFWITRGFDESEITVRADGDPQFDRQAFGLKGLPEQIVASIRVRDIRGSIEVGPHKPRAGVKDTVWAQQSALGWFSMGFGALRRLRGSSESLERLLEESGSLTRHMSLLLDDVALSTLERWVLTLEEGSTNAFSFQHLKTWFNDLKVFPEPTLIVDRGRSDLMMSVRGMEPVRLRDLSDGFQSIVVILFETMRRLSETYTPAELFGPDGKVAASGVIMVDEIDSHLHPNWQQSVGNSLCEAFPNFQWIVSTHSPFIAQCRFTRSIFSMSGEPLKKPEMVLGEDYNRLVLGDVEDAYATEAFGVDSMRSDESDRMLRDLARLNWLELQRPLTAEESTRRDQLRSVLPGRRNILPQVLDAGLV